MENNLITVKPTFDGEIEAKIKTLGEIESNIASVKDFAEKLNEYYKNIIFDEDSMKNAKEEKAKINKFKAEVSTYRKDIIKQWKEPIEQFETMAKETESILADTYTTINEQCNSYDDKRKEEKRNNCIDYFKELCESYEIDFLDFKDTGINITISSSEKSLKTQIKDYVDAIYHSLQTIDTLPDKAELLVEFKSNGYHLAQAITDVSKKHKAIQEEQERLEAMKQNEQEVATAENLMLNNDEEDEIIVAPKVIQAEQKSEQLNEQVYTMTFTVKGTMEKLKNLKEYLIEEGLIND